MNRHDVIHNLFLSFNINLEKLEKNNKFEVSDLAYCELQIKETKSIFFIYF